ncbi:hypothetical protein H0H81_006985 [Sphagnurus paluster]|uniref:G domain-containing protein n=1 Tax=Sphagnurus paluster TaxID=117069 RepID=A0A9P7GLB6_9AGAR|nr:hypothetical protein H0H81_006985 [Sphagnurus paluster]
MISGSHLRIGKGLKSCTSVVQVAETFYMDGRRIQLIDTPGFDDTTKSDAEVLRMIAAFLATTYEAGKKLAGVIYMHRISDFRMGGISTRNFKMFRELCGESTLKNVVIVTNMWGEVSKEVGEAREAELVREDIFFKPVLEKGAQILRHGNTLASAQRILGHLLNNHPKSLQIQRELVDQKKDISQTVAGAELNRELMAQAEKHRKEMIALQDEMKEAIRLRDEETRKELEVESKRLSEELRRVQEESQKLASNYNAEKARLEQHMRAMNEAAVEENQRAIAAYRLQVQQLEDRLNQRSLESAGEKADILRKLEELKREGPKRFGGFFTKIGNAMDRVFGIGI